MDNRRERATHLFIVKCDTCSYLYKYDGGTFRSEISAALHARRYPGHLAYVMDQAWLDMPYQIRHDELPDLADEPPF